MVRLRPVDNNNWRSVVALQVADEQREWVAEPAYYLALCHYGPDGWQPLAIVNDEDTVVGFLMWATDPDDGAVWLGGILVDRTHQGKGFGRAAVSAAIEMIGTDSLALSYQPGNARARELYRTLGFVETDERAGNEIVARLHLRG